SICTAPAQEQRRRCIETHGGAGGLRRSGGGPGRESVASAGHCRYGGGGHGRRPQGRIAGRARFRRFCPSLARVRNCAESKALIVNLFTVSRSPIPTERHILHQRVASAKRS